MNYRDYKQFAPDNYYHIYNRGTAKQNIFLNDADRKFFLLRLKENLFPDQKSQIRSQPLDGHHQGKSHSPYIRKLLPVGAFSLISYCLMPNHFHFLLRQNAGLAISKLIGKVCGSYSKYFNKKYNRVGTLFQDQFKAVLVESDSQLIWLSAYIHQNPKVAGLVKNLGDYQWSSYPDYTGLRQEVLCDKDFILKQFAGPAAYAKFVEGSFEKIKERKDLEFLLLDQ